MPSVNHAKKPVVWYLERLDRKVEESVERYTFEFDEDLYDFSEVCRAFHRHIQENRYYEKYDFWTDGCNYGGVDYIIMRRITKEIRRDPHRLEASGGETGGFCWASTVWRFE